MVIAAHSLWNASRRLTLTTEEYRKFLISETVPVNHVYRWIPMEHILYNSLNKQQIFKWTFQRMLWNTNISAFYTEALFNCLSAVNALTFFKNAVILLLSMFCVSFILVFHWCFSIHVIHLHNIQNQKFLIFFRSPSYSRTWIPQWVSVYKQLGYDERGTMM